MAEHLHLIPTERLPSLPARLTRDEARVLRLRSEHLAQGGALVASGLGGVFDDPGSRHGRSQARAAGSRAATEPPPRDAA